MLVNLLSWLLIRISFLIILDTHGHGWLHDTSFLALVIMLALQIMVTFK
jgi:hypothetical protein